MGKIKNVLLDGSMKLRDIFKRYPVTLGLIIVAAILASVIIDNDFSKTINDILEKHAVFFMLASCGIVLCEEIFRISIFKEKLTGDRKYIVYIAGAVVSGLVSEFFVYIMNNSDDNIFGLTDGAELTCVAHWLFIYILTTLCITVLLMCRRGGQGFSRYALSVFSGVVKTTVVYGLFALGVAAIVEIVNVLLFDTGIFLERIELFMAAGIYVPALLLALSEISKEVSKFAKVVVEYVLLPLLLVAFAIIYIYIIKILITWTLPSNEVFNICAYLFCFGAPVWIMASVFNDHILGKIAKMLPFVFIPFIILQAICIGLRVSQYGITENRYYAIVLIVCELIYLGIYFIKQGAKTDLILVAIPLIALFALIVPFTNYEDAVFRSMSSRLEKMIKKVDDLTEAEKAMAESYYRELYYSGDKGKEYIDNRFTEDEKEMIAGWNIGYGSSVYRHYYNAHLISEFIDISGYNKMIDTRIYSDNLSDDGEMLQIIVNDEVVGELDWNEVIVNLKEYVQNNGDDNADGFLDDCKKYSIADERVVVFTSLYVTTEGEEVKTFEANGYILEK